MARVKLKITNVTNEKVRVGRSWKSDDPYLEPNEVLERNIKPDTIGESSVKHLDHLMKKGDVNIDIKPKYSGISDLQELLSVSSRSSEDNVAEVWVAPDGDDQNPGTRNAPFASIQYAIDTLVEQVPSKQRKVVNLEADDSEYILDDTVIINESRITLRASTDAVENTSIDIDVSGDFPPFLITGMTTSSARDYLDEGGPTYDFDGTTSTYTYTGASLKTDDRELSEDFMTDIVFDSIRFNTTSTALESYPVVSAVSPVDGNGTPLIFGFTLKDCSIRNTVSGLGVLCKNIGFPKLSSYIGSELAIENSYGIRIKPPSIKSRNYRYTDLIVHSDTNEGSVSFGIANTPLQNIDPGVHFNNVYQSGTVESLLGYTSEGELTSSMTIAGDAVMSGPMTRTIVNGNLTVPDGRDIDFTQVTVKGDVDVSDAGVVNWDSGSIGGTITDPDDKIGDLGGGGGESLEDADQEKLDTIQHGQITTQIAPLDIGHRDTTNTFSGTRYGALTFEDHAVEGDGWWRFSAPVPFTRTGGDVVLRILFSMQASGDVGETVKFEGAIKFGSGGENLGTSLPEYDIREDVVVDIEGVSHDDLTIGDITFSALDWQQQGVDTLLMEIRRAAEHADDNTDTNIYVHDLQLIYEGWSFGDNLNEPT